eukprot:2039157-Pyramimonas_sp.AAC.1
MKSKKFANLSSLMSSSAVATQESRGTEEETRDMIHFLGKPCQCIASFMPNAAGGVIVVVPVPKYSEFKVEEGYRIS